MPSAPRLSKRLFAAFRLDAHRCARYPSSISDVSCTIYEHDEWNFHDRRATAPAHEPVRARAVQPVSARAHRVRAPSARRCVRRSELGVEQEARPGKPERRQDRGASGVVGDDVTSASHRGSEAVDRRRPALPRARVLSSLRSFRGPTRAHDDRPGSRLLRRLSGASPLLCIAPATADRGGSRRRASTLVRVSVPGSPRVPPHLRFYRRELATRGAPERCCMAIDLHPRLETLPAIAVRENERRRDTHHRTVGDREGARGARPSLCPAIFRSSRSENNSRSITGKRFSLSIFPRSHRRWSSPSSSGIAAALLPALFPTARAFWRRAPLWGRCFSTRSAISIRRSR